MHTLFALTFALMAPFMTDVEVLKLHSPDDNLVATVQIKDIGSAKGCLTYRIDYKGRPVISESLLGLDIEGIDFMTGLQMRDHTFGGEDTTWETVCGERKTVRNHYRQLVIHLQASKNTNQCLQVTFRAYNEGIAFCYTVPTQAGITNFTLRKEATQFALMNDPDAWAVYSAQGNYSGSQTVLSKLKPGVERPLTVRISPNLYAAISEAKLVDYTRMKLRLAVGKTNILETFLDAERSIEGKVTGAVPFTSPWRVVMVADTPGRLLEQNYLILNLNDPCAIADTSWIKPGKVLREVTLTTVGGKECVDFCTQMGMQYVEYDAGWYGLEYDPKSDAREVNLDPKRNPVPNSLDLHEVIRYATSKGIGIILYVNHIALEKQIDEILPLYQKWGVKGVKFGFVKVGSQHWTRWLHSAIRKAAECRLMVDIHDEFRSMGYQRTYPNLMTVEGILGNEGFPPVVHDATLPFTRFLTGAGDYTFCWLSPKLQRTRAHQLALSTMFFSPWQFLFWYDRPSAIQKDPELDYWMRLPTVWDETRVIHGEIGKVACIARRKDREWWIGAIQTDSRQEIKITLEFLARGEQYTASIYTDKYPDDAKAKEVRISRVDVDNSSVIKADLNSNGGCAIWIVPKRLDK